MNKLNKLAIAITLLSSTAAIAATNGALETGGASSSGNLDIQLTVDSYIQVNRLDNIPLGTYAGSGDISSTEQFCVRSNADTFKIKFNDYNDLAATSFKLDEDSGSDKIDFTLEMAKVDSLGVVGAYNAVNFDTDVTGVDEKRVFSNCSVADPATGIGASPRDNLSIRVSVSEGGTNGLANANINTYTGYLGVVVAPE